MQETPNCKLNQLNFYPDNFLCSRSLEAGAQCHTLEQATSEVLPDVWPNFFFFFFYLLLTQKPYKDFSFPTPVHSRLSWLWRVGSSFSVSFSLNHYHFVSPTILLVVL